MNQRKEVKDWRVDAGEVRRSLSKSKGGKRKEGKEIEYSQRKGQDIERK